MAESSEALGEPVSLTTKVNIFLLASVPLAIVGAVFAGVTNSITIDARLDLWWSPLRLQTGVKRGCRLWRNPQSF